MLGAWFAVAVWPACCSFTGSSLCAHSAHGMAERASEPSDVFRGAASSPASSSNASPGSAVAGVDMSVLGGHLDFALRNATVSGVKRTWELVEWPKTLLDYKPAAPVRRLHLVRAPGPVEMPAPSAEPDSAISGLQPKRLKSDLTWEKKLQAREVAAYRKWSGI